MPQLLRVLVLSLAVTACSEPVQGPKGDPGPQGPAGAKGEKGDPGAGPVAVVLTKDCASAWSTTLSETERRTRFFAVFELDPALHEADFSRFSAAICGADLLRSPPYIGCREGFECEGAPVVFETCESRPVALANGHAYVACGDDLEQKGADGNWKAVDVGHWARATLRAAP